MKIVFLGTPAFVEPVLTRLEQDFEVVAKVRSAEHFSSLKSQISTLSPDLFVVAAFGKILPKSLLDVPKYGSLNVHPSLLPKYRGPSPIQSAILNGDRKTGVSFMLMDEEVDHGSILKVCKIELKGNETLESLSNQLFNLAAENITGVINDFVSGKLKPKEQDHSKATFCKTVKREDGFIDPQKPQPPQQLERMIRAYYPWPGVWTELRLENGKLRIKLLPQQKIQVEGKKPLSYKDFINGYKEGKEILEKLNLD